MSLLLFHAFTVYPIVITAAPLPQTNNTNTTEGWVSDPNGRGTFSIISSCILTLSLCVWSAIHLNVPRHGETEVQAWLKTTKWVILGILAPELVTWVAWRQYASARKLQRLVEEHFKESNPVRKYEGQSDLESASTLSDWTLVHSFYAGMGGFAFTLDESLPFASNHPRLTITPRGMALLAQCGHLPDITKEEILDKSKADNLSKFISCLQAIWMLIQILGRVATNLPVTQLEVNTVAHILCAFLIYILWWHKPKLIAEPTKLNELQDICTYMYMSSKISGWKSTRPGLLMNSWHDPEMSILAYVEPSTSDPHPPLPPADRDLEDVTLTSTIHEFQRPATRGYFKPRPPTTATTATLNIEDQKKMITKRLRSSSTGQTARWTLAADAMQKYLAIGSRVTSHRKSLLGAPWLEPQTEELVTDCAGNWPAAGLFRGVNGLFIGVVLWFASMAYGAVHLAAWNQYFPTPQELFLWRFSALCITGSGLVWSLINMMARMFPAINAFWDGVVAFRTHRLNYVWIGTLCGICGLAYCFSRVFLVFEAFVSLRKLPSGAFETPDWTQVVPHL